MSSTEMYVIQPDGEVRRLCGFQNSHRGAMLYWREIAVRYGIVSRENQYGLLSNGLDEVWKLADSSDVDPDWRIVLASTFDKVMVRRKDFSRVAKAFENFGRSVCRPAGSSVDDDPGDYGHALDQARILEVLDRAGDPALHGVCWNQTSVNCNPWWVYDDCPTCDGPEEEGRAYNIDKDTFGWWLDIPALENSAPEDLES